MKRSSGKVCIILGAALLLAALSLVLFNVRQDKKSGMAAAELLSELKKVIPSSAENVEVSSINVSAADDLFSEYATDLDSEEKLPEETTIELDGAYYLGIVEIPELGIELPVFSDWNYDNLKSAPCRYRGTTAGGDLIIAAHNYNSHFGRLSSLDSGDEIFFTEANGAVHRYEIVQTESIGGRDVEAMEFGSADEWDLTLFTCTLSGQSRVTVRAVLADKG